MLASPHQIVVQSKPKDSKSRRANRPLLDRASTHVPPPRQNRPPCSFVSSHPCLNPRRNPHSVRGTAATHLPRFRALALFGRRPPQRVEAFVIAGSRKPAQQPTHASQEPTNIIR